MTLYIQREVSIAPGYIAPRGLVMERCMDGKFGGVQQLIELPAGKRQQAPASEGAHWH
ncbi:hypothetical protein [Stenotrophomonas sp.]|jgi:hypothetical protein|uniref:hypothetical protein n=1 Tax=Stenotrophomonas sp. TaxID=69392 RepID=UPI00333EA134